MHVDGIVFVAKWCCDCLLGGGGAQKGQPLSYHFRVGWRTLIDISLHSTVSHCSPNISDRNHTYLTVNHLANKCWALGSEMIHRGYLADNLPDKEAVPLYQSATACCFVLFNLHVFFNR